MKAELADTEPLLGTHGWTKRTTREGTRPVEVAGSSRWIQRGAGFIVDEIFQESLGVVIGKGSGAGIPGKSWRQADYRCASADANGFGALWVATRKVGEPLLKPGRVQLGDREDAHAALRTAGAADQPLAASPRSIGECSIEDLYEFLVSCGEMRLTHD